MCTEEICGDFVLFSSTQGIFPKSYNLNIQSYFFV